jgi:hypothetical protein
MHLAEQNATDVERIIIGKLVRFSRRQKDLSQAEDLSPLYLLDGVGKT